MAIGARAGDGTRGRALVEVATRSQAGRPTSAELERRKATIIEVAMQLFVAQGYAETSLVDIAKRASVATRTLYQHFGDKEAIFEAVLSAYRDRSLMPLNGSDEDLTVYEALHRQATALCVHVFSAGSVDLMRLMVAESRRFPDLMKQVATTQFSRVLTNIRGTFERLADDGLIPDGDHMLSARLFVDLVLGNLPILAYTNWATIRPTAADIDRKLDLFITGRFGEAVAGVARTKRPDADRKSSRAKGNKAVKTST